MDKTGFLSAVSIFSQMTAKDLERIAEHARVREFEQGELIIKEGERDNRLFIVINGRVEAIKRLGQRDEKILGVFGPRAYFGEMAMIDDLERSASVVAAEHTRLLCLEQLDLHKEMAEYPGMAFELLQMMSRRLRAAEKFIVNTLGSFLPICASCKKIREKDGSWIPIEAYISDRSETEFSHGICPECAKKLYPEFYNGA
jgi:CRP-like cAMP-binding protein